MVDDSVPPKFLVYPETQNVTLYEISVFKDVIKGL